MAGKKNTKAVSDEEIISALIQHGTIQEAAQAAGISPRTVYDRMDDKEFQAVYRWAKTDLVRTAVFSINEKLSAAVDTVAGIMNNKDVNPAVRLQAAQTILNNAGKFAGRLELDERESRNANKPSMWDDFLKP